MGFRLGDPPDGLWDFRIVQAETGCASAACHSRRIGGVRCAVGEGSLLLCFFFIETSVGLGFLPPRILPRLRSRLTSSKVRPVSAWRASARVKDLPALDGNVDVAGIELEAA